MTVAAGTRATKRKPGQEAGNTRTMAVDSGKTLFVEMGDTRVPLFVLNSHANHHKSIKLLNEVGMRPLTRQEALLLLVKDDPLRARFKGKWFWLAGDGSGESGIFTVDAEGELAESKSESGKTDNVVRFWAGMSYLSLTVLSDDFEAHFGRGFNLYSDGDGNMVAPIAVGVPKDWAMPAKMLRK